MSTEVKRQSLEIERSFSNRPTVPPRRLFTAAETVLPLGHLDREQLFDRARSHGSVWVSSEEQTIDLPTPEGDIPDAFRKCAGRTRFPRTFVCELADQTLVGAGCTAITPEREVILETTDNSDFTVHDWNTLRHVADDVRDYVRSSVTGRQYRRGTYVALAGRWTRNYYHWLLDCLPQLRMVQQFTDETGVDPTLIVDRDMPAWKRQSLELMGYSSDDWIEWTGDPTTVDRLVVPTQTRYSVLPSVGEIRWMTARLTERVGTPDPPEGGYASNVYVSRDDASARRVLNEDEVMETLSEHGFRKYRLSELTLPQQIALFGGADTIVGPSGAGLVNMVFADSPRVLNVVGGNTNPCHYCLAASLGFEYRYVGAVPQERDMTVAPESIVSQL